MNDMFWKTLVCLELIHAFALGYYVPLTEGNNADYDNFICLSRDNARILKHTSKKQNIYYSPLVSQIMDSMNDMIFCYTVAMDPNNEECQKRMNIARILNSSLKTFADNPHVTCNVNTVIFINQQDRLFFNGYLNSTRKYYDSKIIEMQVNSSDNLYEEIDKWVFEKSRMHYPCNGHTDPLTQNKSIQFGILSFKSSWDIPKILRKNKKTFTTEEGVEISVTMITYEEKIAYHNFTDLKIEAISLPYKGKEFSVVVILPYRNEGLNAFSSFTPDDYECVFSELKRADLSLVNFEIPLLNSTSITFDQVGSIINEPYIVQVLPNVVAYEETRKQTFYVDRPYAMFIYHEKTSVILHSVFIRDPSRAELLMRDMDTCV